MVLEVDHVNYEVVVLWGDSKRPQHKCFFPKHPLNINNPQSGLFVFETIELVSLDYG